MSDVPVNVAIVGATGRMGILAERVISSLDDFEVSARLTSRSDLSEMLAADIVFDVSTPAASRGVVEFAVAHGRNVLVGTSGWSAERLATLEEQLSKHADRGVIVVPNFSIGSVVATYLAETAARFFESIEIIEAHHAHKIDSPSGTAVRAAERMSHARGERGLELVAHHADHAARGQIVGDIPVHSVRLPGVVAHQDIIFGGDGETLTIAHNTTSSTAYETGIALGLRAVCDTVGLTVGLDALIGLS